MIDHQHTARGRAELFNQTPAFKRFVAHGAELRTYNEVLQGIWFLGNNYRGRSGLYGEFPPGFLLRVFAMFPDVNRVLHLFAGSLTAKAAAETYRKLHHRRTKQITMDSARVIGVAHPTISGKLPGALDVWHYGGGENFDLCIADPPYSLEDAKHYGYDKLVSRRATLQALHQVMCPGAWVAWLDTQWPMHNKTQWLTVGRIAVVRSTNHRVRLLTLFRKVGK